MARYPINRQLMILSFLIQQTIQPAAQRTSVVHQSITPNTHHTFPIVDHISATAIKDQILLEDHESKRQHEQESLQIENSLVTSAINQTTNNTSNTLISWSDENFLECVELWNLSNEEIQKMRKLKKKLADIQHWKNNPFDVVRFLVEYKGNIDDAETKFRAMIDWRTANDVDKVLSDYTPPHLFNYFPVAVLKGVDRDGDPIHVERTGASDTLGLFEKFGKEEMIKHAIWIREQDTNGRWQKEYENKHGHRVKQFTIIMDLKDLNRRHLSPSLTPVGKEVTRFVQDNYPGLTKRIIILRAPTIFRMAWYIFKPLINSNMREKIVFSSPKDYEQVLDQYIDPTVLPEIISESKGEGEAATGFKPYWKGGLLPEEENMENLSPKVELLYDKDLYKVPIGLKSC